MKDKLQIKWTNDIIYSGYKLGGILCHYYQDRRMYIAGVGINTNNEIDSELGKFGAICLKDILGFEVSNKELCRLIIKTVEDNCVYMDEQSSYLNYCNDYTFWQRTRCLYWKRAERIWKQKLLKRRKRALLTRNEKGGELLTVHTGSILKIFKLTAIN
jgi:biotin-(acetyl-CoA carboxylase) ligase